METIRLEGVKDLEQALKRFDVNAYKNLNKAINRAAGIIRRNTRGYIPENVPPGLSNWAKPATGKVMNGINPNEAGRVFPRWDAQEMRSRVRTGKQKSGRTRNGWGQTVYVEQKSPAGNIYEKAGVVAVNTRRQFSRNPNASQEFKEKLQNFYFVRTGIGRALIRAGIENAGQAKKDISRARYEAELQLQQEFNREALKHG